MLKKIYTQKGSALVLALMISVLLTIIVSAFVFTMNFQQRANQFQKRFDKSLWLAETGISRFVSGLKNANDFVAWNMAVTVPTPPTGTPTGYWLSQYKDIKDDNNKLLGQYKIDVLKSSTVSMTLRAVGKAMESDGTYKIRGIGVVIDKFTLGAFAIASNHQVGGSHINGGTNVHGGIWTSGDFHLDSASCGIYNDYSNLAKNLGAGYSIPTVLPNAEVFIYKDNFTTPVPNPNGVLEVNNSTFGTSANPIVGLHTENNSLTDDPGNGTAGTAGDGIIGNGESGTYQSNKDHDMPAVSFPDVSPTSDYVVSMKAKALDNGNSINTGNVTLDGSANVTIGLGMSYNKTTKVITLNGTSYIIGNLTVSGATYIGKGVIIVEGNATVTGGFEPTSPADFPTNSGCAIVATGSNTLGTNTGSSTVYAGYFWGNTTIAIQKANVYGSVMGNTVNLPTTGTRPEIYIRPDLVASLSVPLPDFGTAYVKRTQWWEISGIQE